MRLLLLNDWTGPTRDGQVKAHLAGEVISVRHNPGARLVNRRIAKWIEGEAGDPYWVPVEALRMGKPEVDKMIRSAHNK